jgi:hypothetical protein
VSGQIARAWAGPVPHREAAVLAAIQHDVGMAQWDLTPELDHETGRPVGFMDMALETHVRLWSLAPQRLFTQSRVAALCVSLHGTRLYERRDLDQLTPERADAVRAYLAGQRALHQRLGDETGVTADEMRALQALMFAWDWLSLALCLKWTPSELGGEVPLALRDDGTLDPWPFTDDEIELTCEGRRLTGRASSQAELHGLIERAERVDLRFRLAGAAR